MFLSIMVFPTILLQANLLIAMKHERKDMQFNLLSLLFYITGCLVGLYVKPSLDIVNYSSLLAFIIFHLLQDKLLIKEGITSWKVCVTFYVSAALFVFTYIHLVDLFDPILIFVIAGISIVAILIVLTPRLMPAR
jgi:hypothetical protein